MVCLYDNIFVGLYVCLLRCSDVGMIICWYVGLIICWYVGMLIVWCDVMSVC